MPVANSLRASLAGSLDAHSLSSFAELDLSDDTDWSSRQQSLDAGQQFL
jgi:hypothetical protein